MDINSNTRGSHATSKPKHISRLRKEMLQHRMHQNPFSSPPSSTGSHDTVSTTTAEDLTQNLSDFSFSPDGEGTRRFHGDFQNPSKKHAARSGRFGSKQMDTVLNTSVIARTFPEWTGLLTKDNLDNLEFTQTNDMAAPLKPVSAAPGGKENMPPNQERAVENTFENMTDMKRKRFRTDLHARVENESDCSTVLSLSPARPASASRRSRFAPTQPEDTVSPDPVKRSLQDMVSKIRIEKQTSKRDLTPKRLPPVVQQNHETPAPTFGLDNSILTPTSRSFFLPSFRHLPDWTSGTLKFSTMKNGVPVFVRSGKNGVRLEQHGSNHDELRSIGISKEDEEIFVSMDKLQEEVRELHDHDAMLQREAEKLQREVTLLQAELKRLKTRKLSDSAIGSESDASFRRSGGHNDNLEYEIAQLRHQLDQASRQVGVNDIHSAALAAERDEALHQASVARERATKFQAELEATQKDLEATLQLLQEKEELQLENEALLTENQTLKEQRDAATKNNKTLAGENEKLRRELSGVQKDLRTTREELASVHEQHEALEEEKRHLAQDHGSMERNNENYFMVNKKLQAQVAARDQHIADLKRGISSRDKMLDNIQGLTTDTAVLELNAELQAEVDQLHDRLEQQEAELNHRDSELSASEGRIRSLKEQNIDLSIDNERLHDENKRLRTEQEEIRSRLAEGKHKVARLSQILPNDLTNDADDCIRLDDDLRQREVALLKKLERREAAVQKVKRLSSKISEIAEQEFTGKTAKMTRIIEPKDMQTETGETTGKSAINVTDDELTRELHLTEDSDFASVMEGEIVKLKHTYRELQRRVQQDPEISDYTLPSLPPTLRRRKSDSGIPPQSAQTKAQLPSILKKSSQFEDTGRFSVKSALSVVGNQMEDEAQNTAHTRRSSVAGTQELPRPETRLRRNSEATRDTTEPNMTSAFFIPDITMEGNNNTTTKQGATKDLPLPSLSKDARRVLDGICKHNSVNCNVCVRIATHGERQTSTATAAATAPATVSPAAATGPTNKILITPEDVRRGKKTVLAEKPIPVSDRISDQQQTALPEEPTVRPAMPPGEALAILIKETQDEIDHLQMELKKVNEVYFALDKAVGMRERRRVMGDIKRLQGELEAKSGHLYRLHDVLEGQKQAGQLMEGDGVDVTVLSGLLRAEVTCGSGRTEGEWEGFE